MNNGNKVVDSEGKDDEYTHLYTDVSINSVNSFPHPKKVLLFVYCTSIHPVPDKNE